MNKLIDSINNDTYYPTPPHLIAKMLNGVDFRQIETILEPSAGTGNIAKACIKKYKNEYYSRNLDIDCVEIDLQLQQVLRGESLRVIHNDFLTLNTYKKYDLIIMNPPFDNGSKHLIKALNMQADGGGIICLLNAETLKNPYSNERKTLLKQLDNLNANIQYLKNEFLDAERKTAVEIALIKVQIPAKEKISFIFENLKKSELQQRQNLEPSAVIENDYIKSAIAQCNLEIQAGLNLIDEYEALKPYMLNRIKQSDDKYNPTIPIIKLKIDHSESGNVKNSYVQKVRSKYWDALFHNPKFTKKLTSNLQKELYARVEELKDYEFSEFNIMQITEEIQSKLTVGVEATILALFDKLSGEHSWYPETKNNIHYYNGWATNKAHKINNKVILPINGFSSYNYLGKTEYSFRGYEVAQTIDDMLKAIDYLIGKTGIMREPSNEKLSSLSKESVFTNIEFSYFTINLYKKGTAHIKFTDQTIVDQLNIFGSQHRNWLPPSYGKKKYSDMDSEEKTIINEFQGEKKYNEVMANKNLYLFNNERLFMLTDNES